MVLIEFDGVDPLGRSQTYTLGMATFTDCRKTVSQLISQGWSVYTVRLVRGQVTVPVSRSFFAPDLSVANQLLQTAKLILTTS